MDLRELSPICPLHFFDVTLTFKKGKKLALIDSKGEFLGEESFSELLVSFSEEGVSLQLKVSKPFEKAVFKEIEKGDGFEFFIDTRGVKEALIIHKYCHHFLFLPKEVDGIWGVEVTKFRQGDKRELARKESLKVESLFSKSGYKMDIFIPADSLFGYDLSDSTSLKIAYIVHRGSLRPNYFPKSGEEFTISSHPSLWANVLIEN